MTEYSANELMICVAARLMEDGATAFIGTGIPMLAAALAQKLHAPNLITVFEFGGIGARLEKLPLAVKGRDLRGPRPPANATAWFVTVTDGRGATVSSPAVLRRQAAPDGP